jgi:hypothetical protein
MTDNKIQLLREEAKQWVEDNGPSGLLGVFPTRSCWNCNPAHEWMKTDMETPYECFECGHTYFKGERLTEETPPTPRKK